MFKSTKYTNLLTILSLYSNNKLSLYNNKSSANFVSLKCCNKVNYYSLVLLSDTLNTFSVDISAVNIKLKNVYTNNIYYNYKFDTYLNFIETSVIQKSFNCLFFNRLWLEREVFESFGVKFIHLVDTRPLLLNYGDNVNFLLKTVPVQTTSELKAI